MLTTIKEKATGWVAWAIVILITIPFALWGIQSYFEGGTNVVVAEVDGDEITLGVYQSALADKRRAVLETYGS
ncbi:MAG: SurA N-terminal domain-containing protein, partial [Arenicellales bacterium]|nr:SurA N-terminal domain-containing protein [Arenicellales bacterium]